MQRSENSRKGVRKIAKIIPLTIDGRSCGTSANDDMDVDLTSEAVDPQPTSVELGPADLAALKRILAALADASFVTGRDSDAARRVAEIMFEMRTARLEMFPASMFNEPAWDMLIALYIARVPPGLSDLARSTNTPLSTAVRWIEYLEAHSLVARAPCNVDRRSYLLRLTDEARASMDALFCEVASKLP